MTGSPIAAADPRNKDANEDHMVKHSREDGGTVKAGRALITAAAAPALALTEELVVERAQQFPCAGVCCCARLSPDGRLVAIGTNRVAHLCDAATGRVRLELAHSPAAGPDDAYVRALCFTPDGRRIITCGEDSTAKVWDVQSGRLLDTLAGHSLDIYSVACSASGRLVATGSGDKTVKLWDMTARPWACTRTLGGDGFADGVTAVAFSPDERLVAVGCLDTPSSVTLFDIAGGSAQLVADLNSAGSAVVGRNRHTDSVYSIAFSPDGARLASGSLDHTVILWDVRQQRALRTLRGHSDFVLSVAFSRDGAWLISGSKDRTVRFWDATLAGDGREDSVHILAAHSNSVISVAVSPIDNTIVTASGDKTACVWHYSRPGQWWLAAEQRLAFARVLDALQCNSLTSARSPKARWSLSISKQRGRPDAAVAGGPAAAQPAGRWKVHLSASSSSSDEGNAARRALQALPMVSAPDGGSLVSLLDSARPFLPKELAPAAVTARFLVEKGALEEKQTLDSWVAGDEMTQHSSGLDTATADLSDETSAVGECAGQTDQQTGPSSPGLAGALDNQINDEDTALQAYQHAIRNNPHSVSVLKSCAAIFRTRGTREDYLRSVEFLQRALNVESNDGESWGWLGYCYLMVDDLQKAFTAYQQSLYLLPSPQDPWLWYGLGILYERYNSFEQATEYFSAALKHDLDADFEKRDDIKYRLGTIYKQQKRFDSSIEAFNDVLASQEAFERQRRAVWNLQPHSKLVRAIASHGLPTDGDTGQAIERLVRHDCDKAPTYYASKAEVLFQIGHIRERKQDFNAAKAAYERVLDEDPTHAKALQQLGWLHHKISKYAAHANSRGLGNQEIAVAYLLRSIDANSDDDQAWYLLGRCYMRQREYTKAHKAYEKAVSINDRDPTYWCSIGVLYYHNDQYHDALDTYSRALQLNPELSEVWYNLGIVYECCKQIIDAVNAYTTAAALDPTNQAIRQRLTVLKCKQQQPGSQLPLQSLQPQQPGEAGDNSPAKPAGGGFEAAGGFGVTPAAGLGAGPAVTTPAGRLGAATSASGFGGGFGAAATNGGGFGGLGAARPAATGFGGFGTPAAASTAAAPTGFGAGGGSAAAAPAGVGVGAPPTAGASGPPEKVAKRYGAPEAQGWDWDYFPREKTTMSLEHTVKHSSVVCCVKFSHDGRYMAAGCNHIAYLYDTATGNRASPVGAFEDQRPPEDDSYIRSMCFTPDGTSLITGAEDKTVKLWDIASGRIKRTYGGQLGHHLDIYSLDCSSDGRFVASGSGDKTVKLWETETGECLHTLGSDNTHGPTDGVTSVSISPDGRIIAAGSLDKVVRLWDTATGQFLGKLGELGGSDGHTDSVYSVAFSSDGKYLASGSLDHSVILWDVKQAMAGRHSMAAKFNGHSDFVLSVTFNRDGSLLMSGSKDRTVQFWDPRAVATAARTVTLQGHDNSVISIVHSAADDRFATGSGDKRARIWSYNKV
jgi:WD40 repeat protein/tetratricopeptide (TPR) repeat protein